MSDNMIFIAQIYCLLSDDQKYFSKDFYHILL